MWKQGAVVVALVAVVVAAAFVVLVAASAVIVAALVALLAAVIVGVRIVDGSRLRQPFEIRRRQMMK